MELLLNLAHAARALFEISAAIIFWFVFAFIVIASVGVSAGLITEIVL